MLLNAPTISRGGSTLIITIILVVFEISHGLVILSTIHFLFHFPEELEWRVSIVTQFEVFCFLVDIAEAELVLVAMTAFDSEVGVALGPLRLPTDT